MDFKKINTVYLIGIGGIGMSALARYFKHSGKAVAGYDKTPTAITAKLEEEGIFVHFNDGLGELPENFQLKKEDSLIIFTPAVPSEHKGLNYLSKSGFRLLKRAEVLGHITNNYKTIAVAGTHGKTSISTTVAHLLSNSNFDCLAFLGGISKNFDSNLVLPSNEKKDQIAVVEADEFDRSFLHLQPNIALITAIDADHLDIYQTKDNIVNSFNQFVKKIAPNGTLIYKKGLTLRAENKPENCYTYSLDVQADFYATKLKIDNNGLYSFDLETPSGKITDLKTGVPGRVNAENAVAAVSLTFVAGLNEETMRNNLQLFKGVKRRFDFQINNKKNVYIDDYAHHPEELKAFISSVKEIYPQKKITGVFQPHLFSRTKDFADEFALELSQLDELILLDVYPAREKPIEGVSAKIIFDKIDLKQKQLCSLEALLKVLATKNPEVLVTMGAGNIDKKVDEIKELYNKH